MKDFRNGATEGGLAPEATLSYDGQYLLSGGSILARCGWVAVGVVVRGWGCGGVTEGGLAPEATLSYDWPVHAVR